MSRIDDIIMEFASNHLEFNADDAFEYCLTKEKSTLPYIRKVLMRLVNNGKLIRPSRGVYLKPDKGVFRPQLSRDVMEIYQTLKNKYPFTKICVYEGPWISPLLHHIASNQTIYVEVEKDASEFVFDHLRVDGVKAFISLTKTWSTGISIWMRGMYSLKILFQRLHFRRLTTFLYQHWKKYWWTYTVIRISVTYKVVSMSELLRML